MIFADQPNPISTKFFNRKMFCQTLSQIVKKTYYPFRTHLKIDFSFLHFLHFLNFLNFLIFFCNIQLLLP